MSWVPIVIRLARSVVGPSVGRRAVHLVAEADPEFQIATKGADHPFLSTTGHRPDVQTDLSFVDSSPELGQEFPGFRTDPPTLE